jgi:hypothetical protein
MSQLLYKSSHAETVHSLKVRGCLLACLLICNETEHLFCSFYQKYHFSLKVPCWLCVNLCFHINFLHIKQWQIVYRQISLDIKWVEPVFQLNIKLNKQKYYFTVITDHLQTSICSDWKLDCTKFYDLWYITKL